MDIKERLKKIKLLILDVDGTLTDGGIYITDEGTQFKKYNAKDGYGIMMTQKQGRAEVGIISHSKSAPMVEQRAAMVGIKYVYVGNEPKAQILDQWCQQNNWTKEEVAFIGDDLNDLDIMKEVGITACPADAVKTIRNFVDIPLTKNGGEGCVREFIDEYLLS
ncbi:MAG: HAD-IIIA family hydrolase [Bacteroidota bacterium]